MAVRADAAGTVRIGGELEVARLAYGAMRLTGQPGNWGPYPDPAAGIAVLRRAVELGVTLIDTAHAYGPGFNEALVAEALHPYPDGLVITTKCGIAKVGPGHHVPRRPAQGDPHHLRGQPEAAAARDDRPAAAALGRRGHADRGVRSAPSPIWCAPARCATSASPT